MTSLGLIRKSTFAVRCTKWVARSGSLVQLTWTQPTDLDAAGVPERNLDSPSAVGGIGRRTPAVARDDDATELRRRVASARNHAWRRDDNRFNAADSHAAALPIDLRGPRRPTGLDSSRSLGQDNPAPDPTPGRGYLGAPPFFLPLSRSAHHVEALREVPLQGVPWVDVVNLQRAFLVGLVELEVAV